MHWGRGKMHPGGEVGSGHCLDGRRTGTDNTERGRRVECALLEWAKNGHGQYGAWAKVEWALLEWAKDRQEQYGVWEMWELTT